MIKKIVKAIQILAASLPHVKFMHVCGTHEQSIVQYGLRALLPASVEIIAGPGCPVCITPKYDIDTAVYLANQGIVVTTFGDMYRFRPQNPCLMQNRREQTYGLCTVLPMHWKLPEKIREKKSCTLVLGLKPQPPLLH